MGIGKRIVNLREAKGWTQRELAKRADINVSVLNRIESEERPVRDQELLKFASVLDVTSDYLIGATKKETRMIHGVEKNISHLSEEDRNLLDYALGQDSLSFYSEEEIDNILDDLKVVVAIHKARKEKNNSK